MVPSSCSHPSSLERVIELLAEDSFSIFRVSLFCHAYAAYADRAPPFLGRTFVVTLLLLFASSLSSLLCFTKLRHLCTGSDHPLLLVFWSFGQEGLRRTRHCFDKEVVDSTSRLLRIHEVIELRLVLFKRLFNGAYHFRSFPFGRPARMHGLS